MTPHLSGVSLQGRNFTELEILEHSRFLLYPKLLLYSTEISLETRGTLSQAVLFFHV